MGERRRGCEALGESWWEEMPGCRPLSRLKKVRRWCVEKHVTALGIETAETEEKGGWTCII